MTTVGPSTRGPTVGCPGCGRALDGHAQVAGDGAPESGDVFVCIYCAQVGIFGDAGISLLDEGEIHSLLEDPTIIKTIGVIATLARDAGRTCSILTADGRRLSVAGFAA